MTALTIRCVKIGYLGLLSEEKYVPVTKDLTTYVRRSMRGTVYVLTKLASAIYNNYTIC